MLKTTKTIQRIKANYARILRHGSRKAANLFLVDLACAYAENEDYGISKSLVIFLNDQPRARK